MRKEEGDKKIKEIQECKIINLKNDENKLVQLKDLLGWFDKVKMFNFDNLKKLLFTFLNVIKIFLSRFTTWSVDS